MVQPPSEATQRSLCPVARTSPSAAGTLGHPRQLPRRRCPAHGISLAVQGVEHPLIQRRVWPELGVVHSGRVGQRLGGPAAVHVVGVQVGLAALPVGASPGPRADRERRRVRVVERPAVEHRMIHDPPQALEWHPAVLRAQSSQPPIIVQPFGDAPAIEPEQVTAGVAREIQGAESPHGGGVPVQHRNLDQVTERGSVRVERHRSAEQLAARWRDDGMPR